MRVGGSGSGWCRAVLVSLVLGLARSAGDGTSADRVAGDSRGPELGALQAPAATRGARRASRRSAGSARTPLPGARIEPARLDPSLDAFARDERDARRGRRERARDVGEPQVEWLDARRLALLRGSGVLATKREELTDDGTSRSRVVALKKGLPVFDRGAVISTRDGEITGQLGWEGFPALARGGWSAAHVDRDAALARALLATGLARPAGEPRFERGFAVRDGATVPAWRVTLPSSSPVARFEVTLDARDGDVLALADRVRRVSGTGRVYPKDPLLTPTTSLVTLHDLDASQTLSGRFARVVDAIQPPGPWTPVTPPLFDVLPGHRAFDLIALYRNVTDTARLAMNAGLRVTGDDPATPTVTESSAGEYGGPLLTFGWEEIDGAPSDEAYYTPPFRYDVPYVDASGTRRTIERVAVPPSLSFGPGDGVLTVNLQTDADVAAHELGHHFFEKLVDPVGIELAPISAMGEGLSDAVAALVEGDPHIGEAVYTPAAGQPWIRDLSAPRALPRASDELEPHDNGIVYGGVFWTLFGTLGQRDTMRLLLETMRELPSNASAASFQSAIRTAESRLFFGARRAAVDAALASRGFPLGGPAGFRGFLDASVSTSGSFTRTGYRPPWSGTGTRPEDVWIFYPDPWVGRFAIAVESTDGDVDVDIRPLNGSVPTITSNLPPHAIDGALVEENEIQWTYWHDSTSTTEDRSYPRNDVIHTDDAWVISIYDYPDGDPYGSSYELQVFQEIGRTLGVSVPGSPASPINDSISIPGETRQFAIDVLPCQIVAVRVRAASGSGLDPVVAIGDLVSGELLASDDDSGDLDPSTAEDDLDAMVRGVLVPQTPASGGAGRWSSTSCTKSPARPGVPVGATPRTLAVIVQALPSRENAGSPPPPGTTGGFTINAGVAPIQSATQDGSGRWSFFDLSGAPMPNADGDERPDEFDDDADQDLVPDEDDETPLDPRRCFDLDLDGCDDCALRVVPTPAGQEPSLPDPLHDGADQDADGVCDASDVDAENDGVPTSQDNCPLVANLTQADFDHDGTGDACDLDDHDGDGRLDFQDNCPYAANPTQLDTGGVGAGSAPDGIGDACQCGDVSGDGRVSIADVTLISRSLLVPPTAALVRPQLCDVGGSTGCTNADATIVKRALLAPPTATIQKSCAPARL